MPKVEIFLKAYLAQIVQISDKELEHFEETGRVSPELKDRVIQAIREKPEWEIYDIYRHEQEEDEDKEED